MCWCRRRDSNSHSFRHYPLKIACLPIPPRRLRLNCPATPETFIAKILIPRQSLDSSLKNPITRSSSSIFINYFVGICAAPSAPAAGTCVAGAGTSPVAAAGAPVAGMLCAGAGADTGAPSSTLPEVTGRELLRYARARVATKNTLASTAVVRDRKLALPEAPNRLPEEPPPKEAPMSAPLPC